MLIEDVIEIICEVRPELSPAQSGVALTEDTDFDTLGLSSLELTEVILELEERHEVEIDISTVDAASSLKSVGDIVAKLEELLKEKG